MTAIEADVERRVRAAWPLAEDQEAARALLLTYGAARGEQEIERVRLAIVKLSGGALDELAAMTAAAKADYRDVLMWAEYPEESGAAWARGFNLSQSERQELMEIRARDRKQYDDWRRG